MRTWAVRREYPASPAAQKPPARLAHRKEWMKKPIESRTGRFCNGTGGKTVASTVYAVYGKNCPSSQLQRPAYHQEIGWVVCLNCHSEIENRSTEDPVVYSQSGRIGFHKRTRTISRGVCGCNVGNSSHQMESVPDLRPGDVPLLPLSKREFS